MHTVYESFKDYVSVELLEGDNKYDAGNHGLQVRAVLCVYAVLKLTVVCVVCVLRRQRKVSYS